MYFASIADRSVLGVLAGWDVSLGRIFRSAVFGSVVLGFVIFRSYYGTALDERGGGTHGKVWVI
jgi:hypothetical protein